MRSRRWPVPLREKRMRRGVSDEEASSNTLETMLGFTHEVLHTLVEDSMQIVVLKFEEMEKRIASLESRIKELEKRK